MDRDKRWERTKIAYDLMVKGIGHIAKDPVLAMQDQYDAGITDEFINPILLDNGGLIEDGDVVISFNFRTDRPRQITHVLTQKSMPSLELLPLSLYYCTMTNYDEGFGNIFVVFEKDNLTNTIGQVISNAGLSQLRAAETEKYPHVTFFFNGGREAPFDKETRILVNSPNVATYDLKPEMSAFELCDKSISHIKSLNPDFICLNFANPDMLGHTGVYSAIVKAVETVDTCLKNLVEAGLQSNYEFIVIADHGNADLAINLDGSPNTAHSLNPVPIIWITKEKTSRIKNGRLADVAPTLLARMGVNIPAEMTGTILTYKV
jgi:2,3-bisphosphoglycerate-independent phosphoglycerate mutase